MEHEQHLHPWAYRVLAALTGVIGLACSVVTAKFFILGLERTESDGLAREALIAAGVLMIIELAAFGLAALLPRQTLRALRLRLVLLGLLLVGFECATIYVTQYVLVRGADAHSQGADSRIQQLQATLAGQRQAAAELRANGARDSASPYAWIRSAGAATLREAAALDARATPLARELADLQAQRRPTLTDALGQSGMLAYSAARALLISVMGLVMCGASGALLRAGRQRTTAAGQASVAIEAVTATETPALTSAQAAALALSTELPRATVAPASSRWRVSMAAPLSALAMAPVAWAVPAVPQGQPAQPIPPLPSGAGMPAGAPGAPASAVPMAVSVGALELTHHAAPELTQAADRPRRTRQRAARASAPVGGRSDTGTTESDGSRYQRIRREIEHGRLAPGLRALLRAERIGAPVARRYLARLVAEGVIVVEGRGWALRAPAAVADAGLVDLRQMQLSL